MDAHKYEQRTRRHGNRRLVEAIGTTAMQRTLFRWMVFLPWEAILGPKTQPILVVVVLSHILCSNSDLLRNPNMD